ncbi:dTDP-4-dehydrorhamnose 3,5-epimerase [Pseudanabaena sp. ABRG5-3]|uniref:dTDP-4-dehydrorhamnose 3,5-epimerase n=1 Tax=Pseudanabaena sp. ABRG5-3 TaxID=685565 RepID=UPI000F830135|nr:dTDP-4-dehydrorhamnose 3,5-epimerase [Pseudanabaena sp. ABRG5-3]
MAVNRSIQRKVEIRYLSSMKNGMAEFYTPQASHETMLVQIAAGAIDDLFVHHFQTDQLLVVRGSFVLVVLSDRQYQYIPLSEYRPAVVTIPPNVPHAAINLSDQPCVMVNAVLRHGAPYAKDYQPRRHPFPFDLDAARRAIASLEMPISA